MAMNQFDGFAGIFITNKYIVSDVVFLFTFALFFVFTLMIHIWQMHFFQMLREAELSIRKQQRTDISRESTDLPGKQFFRVFMLLHASLLSAMFLLVAADYLHYIHVDSLTDVVILAVVMCLSVLLLYAVKRSTYFVLGWTFVERSMMKQWQTSYRAMTGLWGIFLYIPLMWQLAYPSLAPLIIFGLLYLLYRLILLIKLVRTISPQPDGWLFLCLYFCAQEIIPLLVFYKGIELLYARFLHTLLNTL